MTAQLSVTGCDRLDVPARQDLSHELRRRRLHRDRRHVDGPVPSAVQDRHGRARGHDRVARPGAGRGRLVQPSRGRHVQRQRHDLGNRELHHCHLLGPRLGLGDGDRDLSRQRGQCQLHGLLRIALRHDPKTATSASLGAGRVVLQAHRCRGAVAGGIDTAARDRCLGAVRAGIRNRRRTRADADRRPHPRTRR